MAKKSKIDLNSGPLEEVTIGTIKEHKYGFIWVFFFIFFFMAVIFFLPEISEYMDNYLHGKTSNTPPVKNVVNNTINVQNEEITQNTENKEAINEKYYVTDQTVLSLNKVKYSNFKFINNNLSFEIENEDFSDIKFTNTFIETYNESDQLVQRIMLKGLIETGNSKRLAYNMKAFNYFMIKTIEEKDYDVLIIDENSEGYSTLSCNKGYETFSYKFYYDKLVTVSNSFVYTKSNSDYDSVYSSYQSLYNLYNHTKDIEVTFNENYNGFDYRFKVDYNTFGGKIDDEAYYKKGDNPTKVNFEMEAIGYSCY